MSANLSTDIDDDKKETHDVRRSHLKLLVRHQENVRVEIQPVQLRTQLVLHTDTHSTHTTVAGNQHDPHPVSAGVTLDRILSYTEHLSHSKHLASTSTACISTPNMVRHDIRLDTITQLREDWSSASVVNHTIVTDPSIRQPDFDLPRHT